MVRLKVASQHFAYLCELEGVRVQDRQLLTDYWVVFWDVSQSQRDSREIVRRTFYVLEIFCRGVVHTTLQDVSVYLSKQTVLDSLQDIETHGLWRHISFEKGEIGQSGRVAVDGVSE